MAVDDDDELDLAELDTSVVQAGAWDPDEDPVGSPSLKAPEWMEWGLGSCTCTCFCFINLQARNLDA